MTVQEIKDFIVQIDPEARHYQAGKPTESFTIWMEFEKIGPSADNHYIPGWRFVIDRLTKVEDDPIAKAFEDALDESDFISYEYTVRSNLQTGYINHHFECEGY